VSVDFCGIPLAHRVVNASGTFDAIAARRAFGDALLEAFPFAAYVSKTVTLAPRQGNPPPRLWELAGGMINSIGLPNKGLEGYLAEDLPRLAELPVPLIVNVMGSRREDVARLVSAFAEREEVAALELNVSCPNVRTGLVMGADPGELAGLLDAVRPRTDKPLVVKLTPNCTSPAAVAAAAEDHGADAVSLVNTLRGMAMDPERPGEPWLGGGERSGDEAAGRGRTLLGFRDAHHAAGAALIPGARLATDDGSAGHHGLVTDLLQAEVARDARGAEVYACGPPPMLEAVRALCAEAGVPAQLALEAGMACGYGACFGCVVPTRRGFVRLCVDGPVLDAAELDRVA
jgi:dihydroorotate dehydrogenase subfamily 1